MYYPNHIRTMLLNSERGLFGDVVGEEYVSADFVPRLLPGVLQKIRSVIFGAQPDRFMLNYRLYQLMQMLHATELAEYVTYHDSRITYLPFKHTTYFSSTFKTTVETLGSGSLNVVGTILPYDMLGIIRFVWQITILPGNQLQIHRITPVVANPTSVISYTLTDGVSQNIGLPGTNAYFNFSGNPGDIFTITSLSRPRILMPDIVTYLDAIVKTSDYPVLFGSTPTEPYKTFKNLWLYNDMYPYRLGGLILALAFRISDVTETIT